MKYIFILFSFISSMAYSQVKILGYNRTPAAPTAIVVAQFSFKATTVGTSGWVELLGEPTAAIRTATDSRSGNSITISSVGTGTNYWIDNAGANTTNSGGQPTANPSYIYPQAVIIGYWFQAGSATYAPGRENLIISGLNAAKTYKLDLIGSRDIAVSADRKTRFYIVDNIGTTSLVQQSAGNTNNLSTFTGKIPNGSGQIKIGLYPETGFTFGYLSAIVVTQEN